MPTTGKISVTLSANMLRDIQRAVAAGDYASTSDVLRDAVRTWQRLHGGHAEQFPSLRIEAPGAPPS